MVGYNAQLAVDTDDGLIVGADVSTSETDWHLAPVIVEAIHEQLGEYPARVIADSGYETPAGIAALEDLGIDTAFSPREGLDPSLHENADGVLVCMRGKPLVYIGTYPLHGRDQDRYRPEGGCRGCPLAKECPFKGKSLMVPVGADPAAKIRNRDRVESDAFRGALIRRRRVERPFAQLKRHDRFTRFRRRGLNKVRSEFMLWVVSYNLRRMEALHLPSCLAFITSIWRQAIARAAIAR